MNALTTLIAATLAVGIGATAVMDAWLVLLKRLGVPVASFALVGRWVGHLAQGRFFHAAIGRSAPVRGELGLGWAVHYAVGMAYAALLVLLQGPGWLQSPTLAPALAVGVGTLAVPLLVMQPGMGAGIASRRTPTPWKNTLRSLANHAVFGLGLYATAALLRALSA